MDYCWPIAGYAKVEFGLNAAGAKITRIMEWVRVFGLHLEWFEPQTLTRIGDLLDTTYRVDMHTVSQIHGKFF